ncbi:MAG: TIM barrel protein [Eubacteriales bacterium]|nr:TIM barrel protein [Eubacteriales bacterium]
MQKSALFGPGGNSESFYAQGGKSTKDAPAWLSSVGLDAYEFEAGNGIRAGESVLSAIGDAARACGIKMSFHTPYFISLSGTDEEKRLKSIEYIRDSLRAAELLGAKTIVVHSGSAAKISREEAMRLASDTIYRTLEELPDNGIKIGLETMGKINQLGTLDEVIELCKIDRSRLVPVVDFGHMNARNLGGLFTESDDYFRVFDKIACGLDDEKAKNLHCHFSKIEWTSSGEKKHLTFADETYGPAFEPLIETIVENGLSPTVICESAGTQSEDALAMKKYYTSVAK